MTIIIRSYQPSDLPECQNLFTASHDFYENPMFFVNMVLQTDMSDIEKNYLKAPDGHWWVAVSVADGRVLGQVAGLPVSIAEPSYYKQLPEDEREKIYELRRMGVAADAQRDGIGSRLLSTLTEFARNRGYRQVHVSTLTSMIRAREFYEKHGFVRGRIEKTLLGNIDMENVEEAKETFKNLPTPTIFEINDPIPEEDQRLMKISPKYSKHIYVQHYSLML